MKTIRLGGVPEHFNLPIHLAIEKGKFKEKDINVEWTTFDGGTGQMTKALRDGSIDACILLTEGIIKDIIAGNPSKIISVYVNTPLIWGVHTGANNTLRSYDNIFDKNYAISRFGSGSHLMSIVDAKSKGEDINNDQFKIIKNLPGALESLTGLQTDIFYWEKYTTKPYVDSGQLRRIGEFITPWPCFVIAATDQLLATQSKEVIRMLRVIHEECDQFMQNPGSIELVKDRYGLKYDDAARWYHSTEWSIHGWVSNKMIRSVLFNLKSASIIQSETDVPKLIWERD